MQKGFEIPAFPEIERRVHTRHGFLEILLLHRLARRGDEPLAYLGRDAGGREQRRPVRSAMPPGANGTIIVIGLPGYGCACVPAGAASTESAAAMNQEIFTMPPAA